MMCIHVRVPSPSPLTAGLLTATREDARALQAGAINTLWFPARVHFPGSTAALLCTAGPLPVPVPTAHRTSPHPLLLVQLTDLRWLSPPWTITPPLLGWTRVKLPLFTRFWLKISSCIYFKLRRACVHPFIVLWLLRRDGPPFQGEFIHFRNP